jgi:hypothetical protein
MVLCNSGKQLSYNQAFMKGTGDNYKERFVRMKNPQAIGSAAWFLADREKVRDETIAKIEKIPWER